MPHVRALPASFCFCSGRSPHNRGIVPVCALLSYQYFVFSCFCFIAGLRPGSFSRIFSAAFPAPDFCGCRKIRHNPFHTAGSVLPPAPPGQNGSPLPGSAHRTRNPAYNSCLPAEDTQMPPFPDCSADRPARGKPLLLHTPSVPQSFPLLPFSCRPSIYTSSVFHPAPQLLRARS